MTDSPTHNSATHWISIPSNGKWRKAGVCWTKPNGVISCQLNLLPVTGWEGNFSIVPNSNTTHKSEESL